MINNIKEVIKKSSIKTEVKRIDSNTFGKLFKLTFVDGEKFTFMLNEKEFIEFYYQCGEVVK